MQFSKVSLLRDLCFVSPPHRTSSRYKMKATHFSLQIIAVFLFVCHLEAAEEKSCAEIIKEMGKKQMSGVGACTKELKFKDAKEKKERANCIMKCVLSKEGILGKDGKFDDKAIQDLVDANMPPNLAHLREKGEAMFKGCRDAHEANLDNADPTCKTYGPLVKCLMGLMSLCKD